MATLLDRALTEGEAVLLPGNAPLRLGPSPAVWLVETGTAEVFAVLRDGEGPRIHLCTAAAGQGLWGAGAGSPLSRLAVGHSGTRLRRIPGDRLPELARDPEAAADLAARLDGW